MPDTIQIGVTNSTTIAMISIGLAPGSLSEAVYASAFFQCQNLSIALNGNIATRHARAPYQTSSSSPVMLSSPSPYSRGHVNPMRFRPGSQSLAARLVQVHKGATPNDAV